MSPSVRSDTAVVVNSPGARPARRERERVAAFLATCQSLHEARFDRAPPAVHLVLVQQLLWRATVDSSAIAGTGISIHFSRGRSWCGVGFGANPTDRRHRPAAGCRAAGLGGPSWATTSRVPRGDPTRKRPHLRSHAAGTGPPSPYQYSPLSVDRGGSRRPARGWRDPQGDRRAFRRRRPHGREGCPVVSAALSSSILGCGVGLLGRFSVAIRVRPPRHASQLAVAVFTLFPVRRTRSPAGIHEGIGRSCLTPSRSGWDGFGWGHPAPSMCTCRRRCFRPLRGDDDLFERRPSHEVVRRPSHRDLGGHSRPNSISARW